MLAITRKVGSEIIIGRKGHKDCIIIQIVEIRGKQVKVGIEANGHIPINRAEVYDEELIEHWLKGRENEN